MKTDFEKGMDLRKMVKNYIPFNICHKLISKEDVYSKDEIRKEWVSFYTSSDYMSLVINDAKEYIKYEITITDQGIDLKTLSSGNFSDMFTPDLDYLYTFIEDILKNSPEKIKQASNADLDSLKRQLKEIQEEINYIENNK